MENNQPKTEENPKGAGAPRIQINFDDFDKLCELQCTLVEIASFFDCSVDTIENFIQREKGVKFSEYYNQKRQSGFISLRRSQYKEANNGNTTMLIFLGKQYLGQKDKIEQEITGNQNINVTIIRK